MLVFEFQENALHSSYMRKHCRPLCLPIRIATVNFATIICLRIILVWAFCSSRIHFNPWTLNTQCRLRVSQLHFYLWESDRLINRILTFSQFDHPIIFFVVNSAIRRLLRLLAISRQTSTKFSNPERLLIIWVLMTINCQCAHVAVLLCVGTYVLVKWLPNTCLANDWRLSGIRSVLRELGVKFTDFRLRSVDRLDAGLYCWGGIWRSLGLSWI